MYHIKRDGGLLCKGDPKKRPYKNQSHITFSEAHKMELKGCCKECVKRYFELVDKIRYPILYMNLKNPHHIKMDVPVTVTILVTDKPERHERR